MTGIIGAMQVEVERIQAGMAEREERSIAGMKFCKGKMGAGEYVVVQCGIGKVNAAMCVQILADIYHADKIINTGIAGSLCNEINIGDIVLSTDAVQHDMDVTALGYPVGQIPGSSCFSFAADCHMRRAVFNFLKTISHSFQVFEGRIVSGDQFVSGDEKKAALIHTFAGKCTEMEGAAIAQAAVQNQIPFLIIRAISDKADGSAQVDYPSFEAETAKKLSELILAMAEQSVI